MMVATDGAAPSKAFLRARWQACARHSVGAATGRAIKARHDSFVPTGDVPTLTDAYAPVDALIEVH